MVDDRFDLIRQVFAGEVERTAVGRITVSAPRADIIGKAIVQEHFPRHEISWIVKTRFIKTSL